MAIKKAIKAAPRESWPFQYAVKFICTSNIPGTSQTTTSLLPGSYRTAVNIHNPNPKPVRYWMKIAVSTSTDVDTPLISKFLNETLQPDQATKVDCSRIQEFGLVLIHGFEGFLVIESALSLDVVAVYTASGSDQSVESIAVVHVPERRLR
jgi:hypothetical protein